MEDARPATSCAGILRFQPGNAEADVGLSPRGFLPQLVFVQQPAPSPSVLLYRNERVGCHGGAVWTAANSPLGGPLRIRRYDMAGALQRNVLVEMPARKASEYQDVDESSFVERDGQIEFDLIVHDFFRQKSRRERFGVRL